MTQPPDPKPPVFLPEPPGAKPATAPPPPPPLPRGADARTLPEPPLHPDWSRVLQPGEDVVWQGRPVPSNLSPDGPQGNVSFSLTIFLILAITGLATVASGSPIPVIFGMAILFLLRRKRGAASPSRRYVLTDRAAYSAREEAGGLKVVACCPLEDADEPRIRGRGLRLDRKRTEGRGRKGSRVDFDDIDDLDDVLDLIRQLRRRRD